MAVVLGMPGLPNVKDIVGRDWRAQEHIRVTLIDTKQRCDEHLA
jgi:hypothetical protein